MWWWLAACAGGQGTGPRDRVEPNPTTETGEAPAPTGHTGTVPDPCATPSITLGSGATAHVPLVEGGPVTLAHGPQGGWHVDVSGVVVGTGQTAALTPSLTRLTDGLTIAGDQPPTWLALIPLPTCGYEFYGVRAYVDDVVPTDQAFICSLAGAPLELGLLVQDFQTGESWSASIEVVAALDPQDVSRCTP